MSLPSVKILMCEPEPENIHRLSFLLISINKTNTIVSTTAEKLKRNIAVHVPDIIVTDLSFWKRRDADDILSALRATESLPVLVWTKSMNEKILTSIFKINNLHFVKQTDNAYMLADALDKACSPESKK